MLGEVAVLGDAMADLDDTNELLRQIREILAGHGEVLERHRAESTRIWQQQMTRMEAMRRRGIIAAAIMVACLIAAMLFSGP